MLTGCRYQYQIIMAMRIRAQPQGKEILFKIQTATGLAISSKSPHIATHITNTMKDLITLAALFTTALSLPTLSEDTTNVTLTARSILGGQLAKQHMSIYADSRCQHHVADWELKYEETKTFQQARGFKMSRTLQPEEQLDFSEKPSNFDNGDPSVPGGAKEKRGGDNCGLFTKTIPDEQKKGETCFGLQRNAGCLRLWHH